MTGGRSSLDETHAVPTRQVGQNGAASRNGSSGKPSPSIKGYLSLNGVGNPQREKLLKVIEEQPGLNIWEVAKRMRLSRGATRHHLRRLIRSGHVVTIRQGHHLLHFSNAMPPRRREAVALLRVGSIRALVEYILEQEAVVKPSVVAERLGISRRSLRRSIKMLANADLVESQPVEGVRGARRLELHPDVAVAWVLWCAQAEEDESTGSLHKSPGIILAIETAIGHFIASWFS